MIASTSDSLLMRATSSPTLRDLHYCFGILGERPTAKLSRARQYAWIDEDPDLAPAPRREVPLSAFE